MTGTRVLTCILGLTLCAGLHRPAAAADPLAGIVQRHQSTGGPGCAVGLSHQGKPPLLAAWGMAEAEHGIANRVDTVFEAGSASKQFTAAAVLLLARDGKLGLGDGIKTYFPELPDWASSITVDQLLNHTSGLRDWRYVFGLAGWVPGSRVFTNAEAIGLIARQRGLNHAPGKEFSYTNSGYTLAAALVERVSGKSLAQFSRERLFAPAGMTRTQWRDDFRRVVKNRATAYATVAGGEVREDMPIEDAYGAGGLLTTVEDMLRWNAALAEGKIGPGLADQMQSVGKLSDGTPLPYGRGLFVGKHRGTLEVSHAGVTAGYRAWSGRYPAAGVAVAVLCNGPANVAAIGHEIADVALPADKVRTEPAGDGAVTALGAAPPAAPGPRWRPSTAELAGLAGRYRSEEADATLILGLAQGRVTLRVEGRTDVPWQLSPTFANRLVFPLGKVDIERGLAGGPCRLLVTVERVRRLAFDKLGPAGSACLVGNKQRT